MIALRRLGAAAALLTLIGFGMISAPRRLSASEIMQRLNTVGEKPFGLLLLGEGGDRDWKSTVADIEKHAAGKYPFQFASGLADRKEFQKAIDALYVQRVRAIVIVPLFVSSYGEVMDQNRYLIGIREKPSKELSEGAPGHSSTQTMLRVKSRVPLVMTKALDDHPLLVELLAARAQSLSRHPKEEAIVLVAEAPAAKDDEKEWNEGAAALAEKVRQKGGFAAARAYALRDEGRQTERDTSENGLISLIKDLRRAKSKVIVIPLALTDSEASSMRLPRVLDGLFVKYDGRTILPDPRIAAWVEQQALPAAKLPDMRLFKDAGKAGLIPQGMSQPSGLSHPSMTAPPALPKAGESKHE